MASVNLVQNGDCSENRHGEKLLSPELDKFQNRDTFTEIQSNSDGSFDKFGEPEILPRLGLEYQAEIPSLIGKSKYLSHPKTNAGVEDTAHLFQDFLIGLPIPLTLIYIKRQEMLRSCNRPNPMSDFRHLNPVDKREASVVFTEPSFDSRNNTMESKRLSTLVKCNEPCCALVPGFPNKAWTKLERDSFLLGLYIFEKNFVEIKLFVETKEMGSVLSFYYNEFYGTQEYRRWSESRKAKRKKCVYGQRIFSGQRQQELLSRILPIISEECQNALLEVSKTFRDEKTSLSDYVFSLKSMVGIEILIKAIGIGTGKQDLTGTAIESSRPSRVVPTRPEMIPSGTACSSLTTPEIIRFISGGYRLSKARSNDLFWEAIWPRLLARGWHSEQPSDQSYVSNSSHCLVFLVPGVKKFSRRKLVKGDHYFDSVSDVLSRVAKDPELIELENEENDGGKIKEESSHTSESISEQDDDDQPTRKQHLYLQPRTPQRSKGDLKFTIVDTSLSGGRVRELRGFPCEVFTFTAQSINSRGDGGGDTVEEFSNESEEIDRDMSVESKANNMFLGIEKPNGPDQDVSIARSDIMPTVVSDLKNMKKNNKNDLQENKKRRKVPKPPLSRKLKRENGDHEASISKRCKTLTARSEKETENGMVQSSITTNLESGVSILISSSHEATKNSSPGHKAASTNDSLEKNAQMQISIGLNLPQFPKESAKPLSSTEPSNDQVNESSKEENSSLPESSTVKVSTSELLLSDLNPRRHSTRNRPPTAKALEALADGYLTANKKRKGNGTHSIAGAKSRTSHRAVRVVVSANEPPESVAATEARREEPVDSVHKESHEGTFS